MVELTPAAMLREYRRQSNAVMAEQAKLFRAMNAGEQRELLFWMALHNAAAVQYVHALVREEEEKARQFLDVAAPTQ
jgi:hypothetical protein